MREELIHIPSECEHCPNKPEYLVIMKRGWGSNYQSWVCKLHIKDSKLRAREYLHTE